MEEEYNLNDPKTIIKPKFNLLYEIGMPTGVKIKKSFITIIIFIFMYIGFLIISDKMTLSKLYINIGADVISMIKLVIMFLTCLLLAKLIFHIVIQMMQYHSISYTFYDDAMIYEDNFLNQHKKNIRYDNVKEVEIRRTIWDRIMGYGVIIIYTNAENYRSNGLIIYSIKNPQEKYDIIQDILYTAKKSKQEGEQKTTQVLEENKEENKTTEEFIDDLKNLNN
ncbi:MAG: PH domain-containing protein [Clostridia bacterium]